MRMSETLLGLCGRLSILLVVAVSLAGCGPNQKERCAQARAKAIEAVKAYRDNLEPAVQKQREAQRQLLETKLESAKVWRKIASCQPMRELQLYGKVQPDPDLTKLTPEGSLRDTVRLCDGLAAEDGVSKATVTKLGPSCSELEAIRVRFDEEIPASKRREGARWTTAQREYLDSLSEAWCRLSGIQKGAIEEYETAVRAEVAAMEKRGEDETLARCAALISALEAGEDVVLDGLEEDPTFPTNAVRAARTECQ